MDALRVGRRPASAVLAAMCAALLAGEARGQDADAPLRLAPDRTPIPTQELSESFMAPYALARAVKDPQANRTQIDHTFSPGGPVGSLGYLCGIDSFARGSDTQRGPASSYGHGTTFLGAKLVLPFR